MPNGNGTDFGAPPTTGGDDITLEDLVGFVVTDAGDPTFRGRLVKLPGGIFAIDAGGSPRRIRRLESGMGFVTDLGELHVLGAAIGPIRDGRKVTTEGTFASQSRQLTQSQLASFFGTDGGTAAQAPAFSSTQAAQTQAEAFSREQATLDRTETARLADLRAENARKLEAIGSLRSLAGRAGEIRSQFRTDLLGLEQAMKILVAQTLGEDPIRGAIMSQGLVQRGTTPVEAHRANIATVGEQAGAKAAELAAPLAKPNFGADTGGLEAQIAKFMGLLDPGDLPSLPTPPVFGLLHGGEVKKAGEVVEYNERPDPFTAMQFAEHMKLTPRIVGEREGGPELALLAPGSKIIPLSDEEEGTLMGRVPGAQEGFFEEFDFSTIEQALSPIYERMGFSSTPTVQRTSGEQLKVAGGDTLSTLNRLGVQPRLVRMGSSSIPGFPEGAVFWLDPDSQLRHIGRVAGTSVLPPGFDPSQIVNLSGEEITSLGPLGPPLLEGPPSIEPGVSDQRYPLLAEPRLIDFPEGPELILPAARMLAGLYRSLDPATREVILSAFGVGGQSEESFLEELAFFSPSGTATRAGAATFG